MVRGKFKLNEVTHVDWNTSARKLTFSAVSNDGTPENERFHKYTPSGIITMTVDNPVAVEQFQIGGEYYVDFSPVQK